PSPSGVEVLRMSENLGYAAGMNVGVRHHLARGAPSVLLLTHDVRYASGTVARFLDVAASHPAYGVLGPSIRWDERFTYDGGLRHAHGRVGLREAGAPVRAELPVVDADWIEGSMVLVRAAVFEAVGLFDERFFMYFEETELCLRAARAGVAIGVIPSCVIEQDHGFVTRPAMVSYLMSRNRLEYARKADGIRGVFFGFARDGEDFVDELRIMVGRRSNSSQRRRAAVKLLAVARGATAFVLGRWGAPPEAIRRADSRIALAPTAE